VIGVSADTPERAASFRQSLEVPYPMVGDPQGAILRSYKVRWPLLGLAQRVSYLIGRDRRIQSAYHSELNAKAHITHALEEAARG
jgi:peroxiredoxin Q/BCP